MKLDEYLTEIKNLKYSFGTKVYLIISDIIATGEITAYDISTKKYQISNDKYAIWL